jgi:transcriptional regulator with XRE-family HTH domain
MPRVSKTAPRVDDSPLARKIGERLKKARLAAGLTQQQLAEGRYTKAYVSALENGLSRPSMAALNHFSARLGIPASQLINDEPRAWARLEADMALACGRWDDAITGYEELLEAATRPEPRAELLSGLAEALVRRGKPREATAAAAEAAEFFHRAGRESEAAMAEYWLSAAQYEQENIAEAKALLQAILARVRGGLRVEPDFQLRLLMALSSNEAREGNHASALAYLEEVRGLAGELDDRRRAAYLYDLALSYRETGDYEAAVRSGIASLELYRRSEADRESAAMENDLALSYVAIGNCARADELAASARTRLERLADEWTLAHVLDTIAQIALARGDAEAALRHSMEALSLAERTSNDKASVNALLTEAKARSTLGDTAGGLAAYKRAGELARTIGSATFVRRALREWADALAAAGEHERAFALMREALAAS